MRDCQFNTNWTLQIPFFVRLELAHAGKLSRNWNDSVFEIA